MRVYVRARAVALPTGLSSTSSFVFHYQLFLGGHLDKAPSSLASFKSRLVLPFWYRLTQVVLEKRPLNGYSVVVVVVLLGPFCRLPAASPGGG